MKRDLEWKVQQRKDLFEVTAVLNSAVSTVIDEGMRSDMLWIRQDTAA